MNLRKTPILMFNLLLKCIWQKLDLLPQNIWGMSFMNSSSIPWKIPACYAGEKNLENEKRFERMTARCVNKYGWLFFLCRCSIPLLLSYGVSNNQGKIYMILIFRYIQMGAINSPNNMRFISSIWKFCIHILFPYLICFCLKMW